MNIECKLKELITIIDKSSKASGKNLSLPVLACLLLEVSADGVLNVKATNLDIGVEFSMNVKCNAPGKVAVPAGVFLNFISSIKNDDTIKIISKEGNISISTKNNSTTIKCLSFEDFPLIPSINKDKKCVIPAHDFINGVKSVWYSASISSIKPELSSIYIYPGKQELVFVATDSFRLAEKKVYSKNPDDFHPILIPYKNIPDILKIIEGFGGNLDIYFDSNQLEINFGSSRVVSRLIDGSFPDYKQIIPKTVATEAVVLKNDLINTIKSAQVFTDSFNQVRFKISESEKKIDVISKNNEVGEYDQTIEAKITGDDLEISFNYKYILDCMQSIDSESLNISLAGTGKPMIVSGMSDKSFTYIVMPMNK